MTLAELDAMIEATLEAAGILVTETDWRALFSEPAPGREVLHGGRIVYRGLPVWIAMPGETRVLSQSEAEAAGIIGLEGP